MRYLIIISILGLLITIGCDEIYKTEIIQLNNIIDRLVTLNNKVDLFKIDELTQTKQIIRKNLSTIQKYLHDTLNEQEAKAILNHANAYKRCNTITTDYNILKESLAYSYKQLVHLKSDLESRALPNDSIISYMNDEHKAIITLSKAYKNLENNRTRCVTDYMNSRSVVNDIILKIKQ